MRSNIEKVSSYLSFFDIVNLWYFIEYFFRKWEYPTIYEILAPPLCVAISTAKKKFCTIDSTL